MNVQDPAQHKPHANNNGPADNGSESEDESDTIIQRPPAGLLQSLRDATGRPVTQQEMMKAWDDAKDAPHADARAASCLDILLRTTASNHEPVPRNGKVAVGKDKLKRELVEISDDSDVELPLPAGPSKVSKASSRASVKKARFATDVNDVVDLISDDIPEPGPSKPREREVIEEEEPELLAGPSHVKEEKAVDPFAQILAIIPDVDPDHVVELITKWGNQANLIEGVLEQIFSNSAYPRSKPKSGSGKGQQTRKAQDTFESQGKKYFQAREAPNAAYADAAYEYLCIDFPSIPKPHVRKILSKHGDLYAPASAQLVEEDSMASPPYVRLKVGRKGKGSLTQVESAELTEERDWVLADRANKQAVQEAKRMEELREKEEEEAGHIFECGCCFGDYAMSKCIQCPQAHLFCIDCARKNAETALGNRQISISCMDQDGCTEEFTHSELSRFMKASQLDLLERLRSEKALDTAELEGLSKCPHCPWACVIEIPDEKLFVCQNEDCLKVTCRACQKSNHLPKTCAEHAEDLKQDGIHKVEEAMTKALIRLCPKCKQSIVKEYGCNKMTCPNCRTLFCFVCQEKVDGYAHFKDQALPNGTRNTTSTCVLWDDTATRQYQEVEAARQAATLEVQANEDVRVDEAELKKLELQRPPPQDPRHPPGYGPNAGLPAGPAYIAPYVAAGHVHLPPYVPAAQLARMNPYLQGYGAVAAAAGAVQAAQAEMPRYHRPGNLIVAGGVGQVAAAAPAAAAVPVPHQFPPRPALPPQPVARRGRRARRA